MVSNWNRRSQTLALMRTSIHRNIHGSLIRYSGEVNIENQKESLHEREVSSEIL